MTRAGAAAVALAIAACGCDGGGGGGRSREPAPAAPDDPAARVEALRAGAARARQARLEEVVATVAGEPIHGSEIEPPGAMIRDERALTIARERYLENAIAARVMRLEAARLGVTGEDELAMFDALRRREVDAKLEITDADLEAEFAANAARYPRFPRVHLRQVFVPIAAEAPAREVDLQARRLRDQVAAALSGAGALGLGEDLGPLAYHLGDEPMGEGVLADPALREVAAALAPGAVSPVVRSARGLHVLVCVDHEPEGPGTFEDARDRLEVVVRARARARAEDEWIAALRARYDVVVHLGVSRAP